MTAKMAGKMAKQLAGSGTGQSLMDRVTQAKHSLAGSSLGKVVAKSSTEEQIPPKKKHLDHLIRCSNEPNVSIPLLVNFLLERCHEKSWVIVFKALITTHHLMNYGSEKISQYMASNNCQISLPHFNDKSSSQSYEMSLFIRNYSKYLAQKTLTYQSMAFDFCKVKRGKDDGVMRTMPAEKLLKAMPALKNQILVLFEFEATEKDLNNLIINAAFILLYKDLIRLFASYNEGMMNLVEKYFSMKRSQCVAALELYKNFPDVMKDVSTFLTVAENLGIGDKESLGLCPVPPKVLEAMDHHLELLETKRKHGANHVAQDSKPARPTSKVLVAPILPPSNASPTTEEKKTISSKPVSNQDLLIGLDPSAPNLLPPGSTPAEEVVDVEKSCLKTELVVTDPDGTEQEVNDLDDSADEATEGLPIELQEEIIAAATNHFMDSAERTNQAVQKSVGLHSSPLHKAFEQNNKPGLTSIQRSRSPSPSRPPPRPVSPIPTSELSPSDPASVSDQSAQCIEVSDKEVDQQSKPVVAAEQSADISPSVNSVDNMISVGDLLDLDFDPIPESKGLEPSNFVTNVTPSPAVTFDKTTASCAQGTSPNTKHTSTIIPDDLLSLDPLLSSGDGGVVAMEITATAPDPSGLPGNLKPAPANVVLRPMISKKEEKKTGLDQLDSTLANLASSLGSNHPDWGKSSKKK